MKKKLFILVIVLVVWFTMSAKHSDDFVNGNYTYWSYYNPTLMFDFMQQCGYNSTIVQIRNEHETPTNLPAVTSMLNAMDARSIDAIMIDKSWDAFQSNSKYTTHNLSLSNYKRYEAEYFADSDIVGDDHKNDQLYYSSRTTNNIGEIIRIGFQEYIEGKSNEHGWKCNRNPSNTEGYAYNDTYFRWRNENSTTYSRLGEEGQFLNFYYDTTLNNHMMQNTYVYFTFALTLDNFDRNEANPIDLLRFELCGYDWSGNFVEIPHINIQAEEEGTQTILTQYDYDRTGVPVDGFGNKLIVLKIRLLTLKNLGMLTGDEQLPGRYSLSNIIPRLYWYGNSDLVLDYIEMEDSIHEKMRTEETLTNQYLNNRINYIKNLAPGNNIRYFYSFDEPHQPQFDSYKRVQNGISGTNPTIFTASYEYRKSMVKSPGSTDPMEKYYQHQKAFIDYVDPNIIAPDVYPLRPGVIWDSDFNSPNFIQNILDDRVCAKYKQCKEATISSPGMRFIPIVQTFGQWKRSTQNWYSWIRPPAETQKMLQYLPLCYGANGIMDYRFVTAYEPTSTDIVEFNPVKFRYPGNSAENYDRLSNYYALQEANSKISIYGKLINQRAWQFAGKLNISTNPDPSVMPISTVMLDNAYIEFVQNGIYRGYIQCGVYKDSQDPSFMIVNRRANYVRPGYNPQTTNNDNFDNCFEPAPYQAVIFTPSSQAYTHFGTHLAMHDPYDDIIYYNTENTQDIRVPIGPGDGKLLDMISTLPQEVNTNAILAHRVVLEGNINLSPGTQVTMLDGTTTRIKSNCWINISEGASFTFRDSVIVEAGVHISVAPNGNLNFDNARCFFGEGVLIEVNGGSLSVEGGIWNKQNNTLRWGGLRASQSSTIILSNTELKGAFSHNVTNSNLLVSNSNFSVPENAYGLILNNPNSGFATQIINSVQGKGFTGNSNTNSKGILIWQMRNRIILHNVNFQNLLFGVSKASNISERDSIAYCHFVNCTEGIKAISKNYVPKIEYCNFNLNGIGVRLSAATPYINECHFTNGSKGIVTELSVAPEIWYMNGVYNSDFYNADTGIESRGSNHRIETSYFNLNQNGIVNHAKSNLNLSRNANNVFHNRVNNIEFYDQQPYEATIQLIRGHNDFYHYFENQTGYIAYDFNFDGNYYNGNVLPEHRIDASRNWFQDSDCRVNAPYRGYVFVEVYDPSNSMPAPPPDIDDRINNALTFEAQALNEQAFDLYKAILDDPLPEEKRFLPIAADGIYRLAYFNNNVNWVKSGYFDLKAIQYAVDDPQLAALLKDYLAKSYIEDEEYQNAINLIQLRIDNPSSEIDSLLAVLDLEIILQLYDLDAPKQVITTKYQQYKYPDLPTFSQKHDEHWALLYDLMNKHEEDYNNLIPAKPSITASYPNPFNPTTTIAYYIPVKSKVDMAIYNVKGQRVKDLINNEIPKGSHRIVWDGKDNNGRAVSSGLYLVRIGIGNKVDTHKVMMLK